MYKFLYKKKIIFSKLRLSNDVPAQSDYVPLVHIYFTLCMAFSLTTLIWFSILNKLKAMKNISDCYRRIPILYLSLVVCSIQHSELLKRSYFKHFHSKMEMNSNQYENNIITEKTKRNFFRKKQKLSKLSSDTKINEKSNSYFIKSLNSEFDKKIYLTKELVNSESFAIMNRFVFLIFFLFILNLNFIILGLCPYYIKSSHEI